MPLDLLVKLSYQHQPHSPRCIQLLYPSSDIIFTNTGHNSEEPIATVDIILRGSIPNKFV